jgi:hypothetical protein
MTVNVLIQFNTFLMLLEVATPLIRKVVQDGQTIIINTGTTGTKCNT